MDGVYLGSTATSTHKHNMASAFSCFPLQRDTAEALERLGVFSETVTMSAVSDHARSLISTNR